MPKSVLWDLDGTLVDSEEYHWLAWRDTMAAEGVSLTHPEFLKTFGLRNDAIIPQWIPDATPEQINQIGDAKEQLYRRLVERRRTGTPARRAPLDRTAGPRRLAASHRIVGSARKRRCGARRHRPRALFPGHRFSRGCHARQARSASFSDRRRAPRLYPRPVRGRRRCARRHPGRTPRRNAQHRSPPQSPAPPRRSGRYVAGRPPARRFRPSAENEAMTPIPNSISPPPVYN